jgi:hypothetical protein
VTYLLINLFLLVSGMNNPVMHPVHVSICNLDLNNSENTVSVKLFKDDFALVLKNKYQTDFPMENADDKQNSQYISKYINSCLQIELSNNKILNLDYKYSQINEDAIWFYFLAEKINKVTKLSIKNTLMLDLWDDQTNLLIISWQGKENGYRFNRDEDHIEIDLNN